MIKVHMTIDPAQYILAARALHWLVSNPEKKDAILSYEDSVTFYVRRNKSSISVFQEGYNAKG